MFVHFINPGQMAEPCLPDLTAGHRCLRAAFTLNPVPKYERILCSSLKERSLALSMGYHQVIYNPEIAPSEDLDEAPPFDV